MILSHIHHLKKHLLTWTYSISTNQQEYKLHSYLDYGNLKLSFGYLVKYSSEKSLRGISFEWGDSIGTIITGQEESTLYDDWPK